MPVVLAGAPNLRAVPGTNVYGVALPTVDGIRGTLRHVGAAPATRDAHGREVPRLPPRPAVGPAGQ